MGGRLDAGNIPDADVALVTTVDSDHAAWLGTDREAIGVEKAGIFRARRPAVYGDEAPPQSVVTYAHDVAAELYVYGRDYHAEADAAGSPRGSCRGAFTSSTGLASASATSRTTRRRRARSPPRCATCAAVAAPMRCARCSPTRINARWWRPWRTWWTCGTWPACLANAVAMRRRSRPWCVVWPAKGLCIHTMASRAHSPPRSRWSRRGIVSWRSVRFIPWPRPCSRRNARSGARRAHRVKMQDSGGDRADQGAYRRVD